MWLLEARMLRRDGTLGEREAGIAFNNCRSDLANDQRNLVTLIPRLPIEVK